MAREIEKSLEQLAEEITKCQIDWGQLIRAHIGMWVVAFLLFWLWRYLRRRKQCHACGRALVDLSAELETGDLLMEEPDYRDARMSTAASVLTYLGGKGVWQGPMNEKQIERILTDVAQIIACGRRA